MFVGLAVGALSMFWWHAQGRTGMADAVNVVRFAVPAPPGSRIARDAYLPSIALTRDGKTLAYVCEQEGVRRLFLRAVDEWGARPLANTQGAEGPFFSPDGRWLGFFADLKLKKIAIAG